MKQLIDFQILSYLTLFQAEERKGTHDEDLSDIWSLTMLRRQAICYSVFLWLDTVLVKAKDRFFVFTSVRDYSGSWYDITNFNFSFLNFILGVKNFFLSIIWYLVNCIKKLSYDCQCTLKQLVLVVNQIFHVALLVN